MHKGIGDYDVRLQDVIFAFKGVVGYEKFTANLEKLVSRTKILADGREPLIFYPRAETIEDNRKNEQRQRISLSESPEIVGVYRAEVNPDYSSPGYTLENDGSLVFYQDIDEKYAWTNDVWVIGEEENVSEENMVAAPEDSSSARYQGQSEYGGAVGSPEVRQLEIRENL